jgi:ribosomal protein S18 acetylase RimI-like enzyme
MESARMAVASDLPAVVDLAQRIETELASVRGGRELLGRERPAGTVENRLRAAIDDPTSIVVVGTYDGVVLGYGLAVTEDLAGGRRLAFITDLAVDPEARRVGIGEAMMDLLVAEASSRACSDVDSWALPGDRDTKNFFESYGLKARLLTVHRRLQP